MIDLRAVRRLAALPLVGIALAVGWWMAQRNGCRARRGLRSGRRLPGLVGFPAAAIAVFAAVHTRDPMTAALLLAAAAGLGALGVSPAWAACLDIGGAHAGVVTGAMNTFGNLGGALSPVVVGLCLERWHSDDAPLMTGGRAPICLPRSRGSRCAFGSCNDRAVTHGEHGAHGEHEDDSAS